MNNFSLLLFEWKHFLQNKFKVIALLLFLICCLFSMNNGYNLYLTQKKQIDTLITEQTKNNQKILGYFDKNQKSPEDYPWIDYSTPFWAIYYAEKHEVKMPSPLMPFSVGQTEQYGYYKKITTWSTPYDADLVEEIANPERLGIGSLDFSFTLLYLTPILLIILLFNIGGLESDFQFTKLIKIQNGSYFQWLFNRYLFYFLSITIPLTLLMFVFGYLTNTLQNTIFYELILFVLSYIFLWFAGFILIAKSVQSSQIMAIKMLACWLIICILIPATVAQIASYKYPINYMTSFIDANRDDAYKIYDLPKDTLKATLITKIPKLRNTKVGKQIAIDEDAINNSLVLLIADLNAAALTEVEEKNNLKNNFIKSTYFFNPVTFFQNKLNQKSNSDYYAFLKYRNQIDVAIKNKQTKLLMDSWNKVVVDKNKYIEYLKN